MKRLILFLLLFGLAFAQKPTTRTPESTDWVKIQDSDGANWDHTLTQIFGASLGSTFDDITVDNAVIDSIDVDSIDVEWADIAVIAGSGDFTLDDGSIDTLTVDYLNDIVGDSLTFNDAMIEDDLEMISATPQALIVDTDIDLVADGDTATTKLLPAQISLFSSVGTEAKFEFFADTLCAIVGTDTARIIPTR